MLKTPKKLHVEEFTLENGARLLFNPMPGAPRLGMYVFLPGGNTQDEVRGISDLTDRLLMKGTERYTQETLSLALDGLTLEMDVDTKRDFSLISATLLDEDLDASLDLMGDVFYNATFVEFEKEKQKLVGELNMELDSPRAKASDLMIRTIFNNTDYGTTSSVFLETMNQLDSPGLAKTHYQKIYQPERMIISVAGDLDPQRLVKGFERYFAQTTATAAPLETPNATRIRSHQLAANQTVTASRDDSNQVHIYQAWLAPRIDDESFYPMVVLNTLLGGAGLSARLFLELRDKQGLAYNVRSSYDAYRHQGLFYIYIGSEPKNKEKCLKGFAEETQKLVETPVSAKELCETQENIIGRRSVFLETASQQASYIGSNFVMGRNLEDIEQLEARIRAVTPADIQKAAERVFSQPSVVSIVGPKSIL